MFPQGSQYAALMRLAGIPLQALTPAAPAPQSGNLLLPHKSYDPAAQELAAMAKGKPPILWPLLQQSQSMPADVFGSPILTGKLGNGPGVGLSGAGTQQNWGGQGLPKLASADSPFALKDFAVLAAWSPA